MRKNAHANVLVSKKNCWGDTLTPVWEEAIPPAGSALITACSRALTRMH